MKGRIFAFFCKNDLQGKRREGKKKSLKKREGKKKKKKRKELVFVLFFGGPK